MEQGEVSTWDLKVPLSNLCRINRVCNSKLQKFLPKQIWSKSTRDELLYALAELFLNFDVVSDVTRVFEPIVLEIASRSQQHVVSSPHCNRKSLKNFALVLSKVIPTNLELRRFAVCFLRQYQPFTHYEGDTEEPVKKKSKKKEISDLDWCFGMWSYLTFLPQVGDCLDIISLLDQLSHKDTSVRWYATSAVCKHVGMSDAQTNVIFSKSFTQEELDSVVVRINKEFVKLRLGDREGRNTSLTVDSNKSSQGHTLQCVNEPDLSDNVVCVTGILLPKLDTGQKPKEENVSDIVIPVASTQHHLRSLALAVSSGKPVLMQGPVGCGKTSLVEHLAQLTGRYGVPHLIKIQLGDQTDSKALLGTYCSTEKPGEFVWRPGALTHAVTSGSWVLLEDVDTAPMDVISLLVAVVETRALPLAGHGDEVRAAPGFHLFATQRLLSSAEGLHRQTGSKSALLEKLCTVVNVEHLCRRELEQVIGLKYPALTPIVDRLLEIYFMLSSSQHDSDVDTDRKFMMSHGGRLISTRDLMTWCGRSSVDFDHRESSQGLKVFQEALDCFVSCLPKSSTRLTVASDIGVKLNVTEERAKYFCCQHKPSIRETQKSLEIGRSKLRINSQHFEISSRTAPTFSYTRSALVLLEKVSVCVRRKEPVLLTGETGTGKTSTVQFLSHHLGHRLHVINLNQQSDSTDFLGGFKPVDFKLILMPVREEFEILFCKTFSREQNEKFLSHIQTLFSKKLWSNLLTLMETPIQKAVNKVEAGSPDQKQWSSLLKRIHVLKVQIKEANNALAFSFLEGTLVKALRNGDWVLLDEINLASAETLDSLAGLLESTTGSVVLTERGDIDPVKRHGHFRLFACMNPATDVGKKDLPAGIRNRFTEFFVEELENSEDLSTLVRDYLQALSLSSKQVNGIVKFYLTIRGEVADKLTDGTGHKPHYSLRTLCRSLRYCARNPCKSVPRSLYEGFCLSFLSQLDRVSHPVVESLICRHILGSTSSTATKAVLSQKLPRPDDGDYVHVADYWISCGRLKPTTPKNYILTPSVRLNLKDLARVVSAGGQPVLLQGETSVGKTSLVVYLAQLTGNVCVRVNNHEHTDLQEYIGSYVADQHGKLVFKEGVLVEAMRKGHWIILDELNLAPTDVLEALNRLLDCNQELFIAETQEVVHAHPKFQLFATQNPPGLYGGRKVLSRAFRNRFIELHFDEIPPKELETILHERCGIPLSYARKLVAVMLELQTRRRGSSIFSGKQGFMTLRDLFRWAQRYNCPDAGKGQKFYDWDQHLADHGYMSIAGRVRKQEEEQIILEVLEKHLKRKVLPHSMFSITPLTPEPFSAVLNMVMNQSVTGYHHMVWTYNMRRLAQLIGQAIRFEEPVLLVGSTGIGKTTVCQMYAALRDQTLHSVNCHMHTESGDFLGGLRPVRSDNTERLKDQKLFEWKDGPLVCAMKEGSMFLIDEISLADDSVLERLNSVLEPERTLVLAERGGLGDETDALSEVESVTAQESFRLFATMNPGGDFGKKELSPALRNRFTEIWCPPAQERQDLIAIVEKNVTPGLHLCVTQDGSSGFGEAMIDFVDWFTATDFGRKATVSIRDLLSWTQFINCCCLKVREEEEDQMITDDISEIQALTPVQAYVHGACLVFVDSLGAGSAQSWNESLAQSSRQKCTSFLVSQLSKLCDSPLRLEDCGLVTSGSSLHVDLSNNSLCIPPFSIPRGPSKGIDNVQFSLDAPTTCMNGQRLLRGLQLSRPILLEGSPGVGKTSLVSAIAKLARKTLIRINLSEQTDVSDLFGADLPVEGEEGGRFAWRDGPFLQALKAGHWVVFDELNLASQSVLEGLNACFDHRSEVYIPELSKTFSINPIDTRIFACQNPLAQGGGRKGLPQSFLNRFTKVYVDPLTRTDLIFIASRMYPEFPEEMLSHMVDFNAKMYTETMVKKQWGSRGSPWEFNLRDLFRWCDLMQADKNFNPGEYVSMIYKDRMRTQQDKLKVEETYRNTLGNTYPLSQPSRVLHVGTSMVQVGHSFLPRYGLQRSSSDILLMPLHHCLEPLESLMKCAQMGWLAILVSPQSCGKTSLVRLLAQLSGQTLSILPMNSAMDTTELLGGFEQSDPWRHVSELSDRVEKELRQIQRSCLMGSGFKDKNEFRCLEEAWIRFTSLSVPENISGKEELETLSSMTKSLCGVVDIMERISTEESACFSALKDDLTKLSTSVSTLRPSGQGGMFEWVDSLLVKAVRDGHWLLVDNVNFCSASVLDRLNALLEPNGELSINERGTMDGQIPTIKPHENFRLFFAMDPYHGEISRAMRNRGIEIYMLGEDDGCQFDQDDMFALVQDSSLRDMRLSQWLINTHKTIQASLQQGERTTIVDLLQVAVSCSLLVTRGVILMEAVRHAMEDVYISQRKTPQVKKIVRSVMEDCLLHLPNIGDREVNLSEWSENIKGDNIDIHRVKNKMRFLLKLVQEVTKTQSWNSQTSKTQLTTGAAILISQTSESDNLVMAQWLNSVLAGIHASIQVHLGDTEDKERATKQLADVWAAISAGTTHVFESAAWRDLQEVIQLKCQSSPSVLSYIKELPWDLNHNPQAVNHAFRLSSAEVLYEGDPSQEILRNVQRLQLVQQASFVAQILCKKVNDLEKIVAKRSSKSSPALGLILMVLSELSTSLPQLVELVPHHQLALTSQEWPKLLWLVRLAEVAISFQTSANHDMALAHLTLHWHWVEDKLSYLLLQAKSVPRVAMALEELHRLWSLGDTTIKMYGKFLENFGHPRPFLSRQQASLTGKLMDTLSRLTLTSQLSTKSKMSAYLKVDLTFKRYIVQLAEKIARDEEDASQDLNQLIASLGTKGLGLTNQYVAMETDNGRLDDNEQIMEYKLTCVGQRVPLWPLFEHMATLVQLCQHVQELDNSKKITQASDSELDQENLREYLLSHTAMGLDVCVRSSTSLDNIQSKHLRQLELIYESLWSCKASLNTQLWLSWSVQEEELQFEKEDLGPAILHQASMARAAMSVLASGRLKAITELLPLDVRLGQLTEERFTVSGVGRHVWCHAPVLGSSTFDVRQIEVRLLWSSFLKLLQLVQLCFTEEHQESWSTIISQLDESEPPSPQDQVWDIIVKLMDSETLKTSAGLGTGPVLSCVEMMRRSCDTSRSQRDVDVGCALVHCGLILSHLMTPRGPVDPVEKAALKLKYVLDETEEVNVQLSTWDLYMTSTFGRNLDETPVEHLHPAVTRLKQRKEQLGKQCERLQQLKAYRPQPGQFKEVSQSVRGFLESSCSVKRLTDLTTKMLNAAGQPEVSVSTILQEEKVWQDAAQRFLRQLQQKFPLYCDLLTPVSLAIHQIKYGLRLMSQHVEAEAKSHKIGGQQQLCRLVHNLCHFPSLCAPTPDLMTLASHLSLTSTHNSLGAVFPKEEKSGHMSLDSVKSRLMICALWLMKGHCSTTKRLDRQITSGLFRVFDLFTKAWSAQEEQRRLKEAEKAALYRYKEETHGDERSEAEREEDEFRAAYPTFEKDFVDVTGADRLEDVGQESENASSDMREVTLEEITTAEIVTACTIHQDLFTSLTCADWLPVTPDQRTIDCDILSPALLAYQLGSDLVKKHYNILGSDTDYEIIGSHLVVAGSMSQYLDMLDTTTPGMPVLPMTNSRMSKGYNFYYDPNIQEVMKCRPLIDGLCIRVTELQKEWPEHPTLILLQQIMDRILSFSVTCPVVKFLTGLELLLEKSQEWESNAATYVSLATWLTEITSVIVQWRKLELSCWSSALDTEEESCKVKASQWWLHLYQLTSDHLTDSHTDIESLDNKEGSDDVLTSLKKFMESSTLGEFCVRLRLLLAFHCQLMHMDSSEKQRELMNMMWNVYQFYKQFEPAIEAQIKQLRTPIEKQLKGFVKIARWSDMNYWALKTSTEKTHRTVHKHIKEYQSILRQPVQSLLGDKGDDLVVQSVQQTGGFPLTEKITTFTSTLLKQIDSLKEAITSQELGQARPELPLLSRLPRLSNRLKSHVRKWVKSSPVMGMVVTFDEFCGDLIQEIHELQGLQVDLNEEKEKQKKEAKSIDLRKRKGLAELFKYLGLIGLSYRKGLTKGVKSAFTTALEASPIDLEASCLKPSVSVLWSGCQGYFYRCISRHAQFNTAIASPSKELTMADIQRCRGYVENFSKLYIDHRASLTEFTGQFLSLRKLITTLDSLSQTSLPPQTDTLQWVSNIKQLSTQLSQALTQFALVLQSCPAQVKGQIATHPSPIPVSKLAENVSWVKGDVAWQTCWSLVQTLLQKVKDHQVSVDKVLDLTLIGWSDIATLKSAMDSYASLCDPLTSICSQFSIPQGDVPSPLVASLLYVKSEIESSSIQFLGWMEKIKYIQKWTSVKRTSPPSQSGCDSINKGDKLGVGVPSAGGDGTAHSFLEKTDSLVESLLLGIQSVIQSDVKQTTKEQKDPDLTSEPNAEEPTKEEESELEEGHLTQHLLLKEKTFISLLRCSEIGAKLGSLIEDLHTASDVQHDVTLCVEAVYQIRPLLKAYTTAIEKQLGCCVLLHRSMGKLLSVLLAMFTELAQKGFCIPPELSDEMDGEGATEFVDAEGGGLGQGEGAKDVSDQIESEDQLDEAKQAGEKGKEDEEDHPDIEAEEKAIEMSDDFDGKLQDIEAKDDNDDENDDDKQEEEDMERQMGDADGEQEDRLDERMWGSDEEDEDNTDQDKKDDDGKGGMDKKEEEMVAKDDNKGKSEAAPDEDEKVDGQKEEENQQDELMSDDENYDDNKVNPHRPEENEEDAKDLDLEDDLQLEGNEGKDGEDEKEMELEETPEKDDKTDKDEEGSGDAEEGEDGEEENDDGTKDIPATEADKDNEEEEDNVDMNAQAEHGEEEKEDEKENEEGAEAKEEDKPTSQLRRDDKEEEDAKEGQDGETAQDTGSATNPENEMSGQVDQDTETDDKQDKDGTGSAQAESEEGHTGPKSQQSSATSSQAKQNKSERKPGKSDKDRTLGSHDKKHKHLKTTEETKDRQDDDIDDKGDNDDNGEYEHVKDAKSKWDAQTVDTATTEQTQDKQAVPSQEQEDEEQVNEDDDVKMEEDKDDEEMDSETPERRTKKSKDAKDEEKNERNDVGEGQDGQSVEIEGERVLTTTVERPPESSIHTELQHLHLGTHVSDAEIGQLRAQLEQCVSLWSNPEQYDENVTQAASEAWQQYLAVTGNLAQELCEQLRLILEPSQATQLKGDYRTGKRLNMRKVIPYIASQFRKDKIWLRRSKPSKRQYQIMIAMDDSSSMADSHTKQLAFECLATVSTALTLLDAGQLAVCSFGEEVRLLHPFGEPLTSQSGGQILQHLTCDQKQTKYGLLLDRTLPLMMDARRKQPGAGFSSETAQLLLVLSDGRGVFREGMDVVRKAVRRARAAHIFLVFVVMDTPEKKGSLLEAKVPILESSGKVQEIKPYLELFPFPFYIILRDINGLPQVLSDALRQWFELVTASDR